MIIQLTGGVLDSPDPSDPVDSDNCRLLGPVALVVQGVMGIIVVLSLVYKRHREKPPRPWRIWLFDVSKQIAGQAVVHTLNLGISALVSRPSTGNNPCTAYFVNVTFDVTIGVGIIWAILHGAQNLLTTRLGLHGFESGQYGTPPSFNYWIRQASVYILAVIVMKLAVLALLAFVPSLLDIGEWLLSWTDGKTSVQIVFVMGIYPIIMNVLQFWLIDSIVKASAFLEADRAAASTATYQPLRRDSSDESESEDDAQHARPPDLESPSKAGSTSRSASRPASTVSTSSAPKSIRSTRQRSLDKSRNPGPSSVPVASSIHDYPPSRQASPLPSPKSASFRSLRKRSPPPSPSPVVTPSGDYGATGDSPRLKQTEPDSVPSGWEWEEDKDARRSRSPKITAPRRESWDLPVVSPQSPTRPLA
ncbi:hypothetical protein FS837_006254 [Tulasnella sp. UAMH 9824]|nr:hypothetical protein FS837_006254 [Tulasnella sp. UAMH 9824]